MSSIDQRIVEMQFDNKQFESGVQTSIKSIDTLKKGLDLDGATKSLSGLDDVAKKFSLAGISSGVETIASKFTTLGIIGVTALMNITNAAINTGTRILKSLTIDPIKTGLAEYETKMNAITTILTNTQSKGTTLDEVNVALNELNTYADKTIYNFAEMTRNIGTFTAAGVDLEKATTSIKGIANLAAGSGSSAYQASTAMYQLSQALAGGSLRLQDWNSVVNAGMGGELFQNALKASAKELGIMVDESIPFRDSLQDGWLTAEVLTSTLTKFAEDESLLKAATQVKTFTQLLDTMKESVQSGWAQSWEAIIGDKDEAAELFTAINDGFGSIAGASADARNTMLLFWKDNGGRDALIDALSNAFKGLQSIIKPVSEAFRDIFPPMTGEKLVAFSEGLKTLSEKFKIGDKTADKIKRTFKGLFALLDIGKQGFLALFNGLKSAIEYLVPAGDGILSFTASLGDFLVWLDETIKSTDAFNVIVQKMGDVIRPVADVVKGAIVAIVEAFKSFGDIDTSGLDALGDKVETRFAPFTAIAEGVKKAVGVIGAAFEKISPVLGVIGGFFGEVFGNIGKNIADAVTNADYDSLFDMLNAGLFAAILLGLKKFIKSLTEITDGAGGMLSGLTGILDGVKGSLEAYQSQLKAGTLLKIASAIGILAASLFVLSMIDSAKLTVALAAMTAMFADLVAAMYLLNKTVDPKSIAKMTALSVGMIGMSVAILILSGAMVKLASLDWNGLAKGLVAVAALTTMLVASAKILSSNSGAMIKGSLGFILFAAAINVLADAVIKISVLDTGSLTKGLIGVGVLLAELALFMKTTDLDGMGLFKGLGLLLLAEAINVLATAVGKFAVMDVAKMSQGLIAVGVVLTELALFVNLTGDSKRVISTAIGLTILGAAMLIFGQAIENMGNLSWEQIGKGLVTMAGALTLITVALNFMPKNMILTGTGLVIVASALLILSKALQSMGGMSWEEIAKGLVTLAGSLTVIAVAMTFMTGALPGAAALLIVAGALSILTPVLRTFGSMSLIEIGKGLLALAGVFVVIGVAGLVLAPLVPALLGLGLAIALVGVGAAAVGVGLLAFSAGLAALAISGVAGATALGAAIMIIVGLIPAIAIKIGEGIVAFAAVIGDNAPILVEAMAKLIIAVLDKIIELTPKFVEAAIVLINGICQVIIDTTPQIVEAATALINGFLQVIIDTSPKFVEAIFAILTALLNEVVEFVPKLVDGGMKIIIGFLKGISDNIGEVVATAVDVVVNFLTAIGEETPRIVDAGFQMMIDFINGLADSIEENTPLVNDALANLIDAMINCFKDTVTNFSDIGKNIINGLIDGVKAMASSVVDSVSNVIGDAISAAKNLLGIESPSKVFASMGRFMDMGMANGLMKFAGLVSTASKDVGSTAMDAMRNAVSNVADIITSDLDMTPTIRPVLDLTNVVLGSKTLNSMFDTQGISVETANKRVASITAKTESASSDGVQNGSKTSEGTTISLTQNNYSPKSLSRLEIYRQTKNQISTMKGLVTS